MGISQQHERRSFQANDVERFMPMVRRMAMRLRNRLPSSVDIDDLISSGWVGVLEVLARISDDLPANEVEALVSCRVRGAMLDHLRSMDPASRGVRRSSRKVNRAKAALTAKLGRAPAEHEIAAHLEVPVDEYRALELAVDRARPTSLETTYGLSSDLEDPETVTDQSLQAELVADAIRDLPERMQRMMGMLYYEGRQQSEVAETLGLSPARVCQLHRIALGTLRRELRVA